VQGPRLSIHKSGNYFWSLGKNEKKKQQKRTQIKKKNFLEKTIDNTDNTRNKNDNKIKVRENEQDNYYFN
jgi:hypothetical protein